MEFITELKVRVQITARDKVNAHMVLKERHGCLIGGGTTAESKDYFIRELRDFRSVLSGPTEIPETASHRDKDKILGAKKAGVMHIHGVDVSMHKPGDKVYTDHGDLVCVESSTEGIAPIQLDLPDISERLSEEPKPKFRRKSL